MAAALPSAHARRQLGQRLLALRRRAGLSSKALAELIGANQTKVSRTELARFPASLDLVRKWLDATGADAGERSEVLKLAEQSLVEMESYRTIFRGNIATGQRIALDQEAVSARIRHFQPLMIPGLLQTEAYARAVLTSGRDADETGLEEAVATRLERGRRIRAGGPEYHVVLMEAALRWAPATLTSPGDLRQAWETILDAAAAPNITVQLIPMGASLVKAPLCGFVLTDFLPELCEPPIAQVEVYAVDLTFSGDPDVALYEVAWQHMLDAALSPQRTIRRVQRLLRR